MGLKFQKDTNETLMTSLIAHWKLDETASATKGGFWKETLNTGKGPASRFVAANSEYLSIADNSSLSMGSGVRFTFASWVYIDSFSGEASMTILSKYNSTTNNIEYRLIYDNAPTNRFRLQVSPNGSSATSVSANTFGAASTGTWYLIIAQYDGTSIKISVNNGSFDTTAFSADVFDGTTPFEIGAIDQGGSPIRFWNGRIMLVGLWKRALTSSELTLLYNNGKGLHSKELHGSLLDNLVSYWNLNETFRKRYDSFGGNTLTDNNTVDFAVGVDGGHSLGEMGLGEGTILLETGVVNTAPRFTGSASTDRILFTTPSDSDLSTGDIDFTVSGWIYIETSRDHTIIGKGNRTLAREYFLSVLNDDTVRFEVGNGSGGNVGSVTTAAAISKNAFHFIVGWHDSVNNTVNVQVDNGTITSASTTGSGVSTSEAVTIGAKYQDSAKDLVHNTVGRVEEVFFWKKILTSTEKSDLYNSGNGNTIINTSDKMLALTL